VAAFSSAPTGLGAWGDLAAATETASLADAKLFEPMYAGGLPNGGLGRDMILAARVVNADVGARVVSVPYGGFDTHAGQAMVHSNLLTEIDNGIEAFFATLTPANRRRTSLLVFSEFGRRPQVNASAGTDHGAAGVMMLVGQKVRGGLHGAAPSLTKLDARGNLVPTVDVRSVYASVADQWLRADGAAIVGGRTERLDLFKGAPAA
jgi:uncharacterized protein (DUF1501 family)